MKEWINKDEVIDLIYWAKEQDHINEDALQILLQNVEQVKTKIEE